MLPVKTLYPLLLVLIIITTGTGCNKNEDPASVYIPFSGPLIKTKTVNGNTSTYTYDNIGRVLTQVNATGTNTFEYSQQSVVVKTYQGSNTTGTPNAQVTYYLNAQGLVDNTDNVVYFTYDADRHMLTENNTSVQLTVTNTYSNGNKITEVIGTGTTYTYQYDTSLPNTAGRENNGMGWMGKLSANLPTSMEANINGDIRNTTYTYEFDNQNRVTRVTPTGNFTNSVIEYTYY